MMGEWKTVPLDSLIEPNRTISYGIVQPGVPVADGVPIVRVSDVRDGRIATSAPLRVARAVEAAYARTRLVGGELLLTLVGTVGEAAVVPPSLAGWNTARAVGVIPVRKEIGAYWVKLALRAAGVREIIDSRLNTTVQPTLNLGDVATLPIVLPPTHEREAIAHILGTLDDKIELNRRMNETLEAMARALFKSWFVDFDPVRAKAEGRDTGLPRHIAELFPDSFEDSELGEIPRGWTITQIADCCVHIQNGGTPRRDQPRFWYGGNIPWLASGEVRQPIITRTESFITTDGLVESSAKWVPAFSTLVALYGATAGQVSLTSSRLTTNQAVCALIPKENFAFFNYLTMLVATVDMEGKAVGSAQQNISKGIVEETPVVLPSTALVERFSEVARPLFERWILNLHQSHTLATLRDALLPKLLSGELRITAATIKQH